MSADAFKPKQKILVRHTDALGKQSFHDGEIIAHVKDDVWRVTFGRFGLNFLIPEKDIQDAEQSSDAQVQAREAAQWQQEGAEGDKPKAS